MTKAIAVVVPTYDRADTLSLALYSILTQTCRDFNLYISDNGTDPRTMGVIEDFTPRFRDMGVELDYHQNSYNRMCGGGINDGISRSEEPYITVLSDDDMWPPNRIEIMANHLPLDTMLLAGHVHGFYDKNETITECRSVVSGNDVKPIDVLRERFWLNPLGVLYNRRFFDQVGLFDETILQEDFEMWLRVAKMGGVPVRIIDNFLAFYRVPDWSQRPQELYERASRDKRRILKKYCLEGEYYLLLTIGHLRRPWGILPLRLKRTIKDQLQKFGIHPPFTNRRVVGRYEPPFTYETMLTFLSEKT